MSKNYGRHGRPSKKKGAGLAVGTFSVLGLGVALPVVGAGSASAVTSSNWDKIAQCESSGDWSINSSGDGMSVGGLQFQNQSWKDALSYLNTQGYNTSGWTQTLYQGMPKSQVPTKAQQITAGEALLHLQKDPWTASRSCSGVYLSQSDSFFNGGPKPAEMLSKNGTPSTPAPTPKPSTGDSKTPAVGSKAYLAIQYAKKAITYHLPYVYGGNGPQDGGWDCSGLTSQAWKAAGVDLPNIARDSYAQEAGGWSGSSHQTLATIRPGDLVAYNSFSGGHVALYVGPIGPNGESLIETNSRHTPGSVDWSFMDSRSGRPNSAITGITRPAPFVPASGTTPTPTPTPTPVPTPTPTPTPQPGHHGHGQGHHNRTYTVVKGDYLYKIAKAYYGDGTKWRKIYEVNKSVIGSNPDYILPGQVLKIPAA